MHILLIHQAFAAINEPGGTRHHEMARLLAAKGHRITIIASQVSYLTGTSGAKKVWCERSQDGENISILRAYTYRALHKSFVHRVISFLSFFISSFIIGLSVKEVDVVWGTSPPIFQAITALMLARLKSARFLFEVRDLWPAFGVAMGVLKNPGLIKLSEGVEKRLYRNADQLMVNSPGFMAHIEKKGGKNLVLVPNGADASMFKPDTSGAGFRLKHQLEDAYLVLYAGAHGIANDLGTVLLAAEKIQAHKNIKIVFLGDGKEKLHLQQQAQASQLSNVIFLPPVAKEEMNEALAAADVCLAILKPIEMFKTVYPNKVFDYMTAGRPMLLAIDGVIREVVERAGAGIFVPPGDPEALAGAILSAYSQQETITAMGPAGRAYILKHFDRSVLTDQLEEILKKMLS